MQHFLAPLGAALLVGCATTSAVTGHQGSLTVQPVVEQAYRAQALDPVTAYTAARIEHLVVKVFTVSGASETPVLDGATPLERDIASSSLSAPIAFDRLRPHTTYRLRAAAYKAPGTDPGDLISIDGASVVDLVVTNDDRPAAGKLPVKLKGLPFDAEATTSSNIRYTPGGMATASETIE